MLVLIMFGLLHAYFLWFGDILVHYGICGLLLYPFRKLQPRRLILIGTGILLIPILTGVVYISTMGPNDFREFEKDLHPTPTAVASDLATFRGGWLGQLSTRANEAFEFETTVFGWEYFWRELGLMLIGMALFKLGVFNATLRKAVYLRMIGAAILVGIPLTLYGVYGNYKVAWQSLPIYFRGEFVDYVASLFLAFGWVGVVMLACKSPVIKKLIGPLKAVGRAAFSNYILQTLICTTLFYGHGFRLYGHISRVGQFGIVLAIWAVQLLVSTLWFRFFRIGPLESLWRSLTYGNRNRYAKEVVCPSFVGRAPDGSMTSIPAQICDRGSRRASTISAVRLPKMMLVSRPRMTKNRRRRGGRVRQSMDFGITLSRFLSVRLSGVPSIVACLQVGEILT
jgi:uncharacterized protein